MWRKEFGRNAIGNPKRNRATIGGEGRETHRVDCLGHFERMCESLFETAIRVVHVWCVRVSAPGASCYRVGTWIRLFAKARAHRKLRFFHSRRIFALFVEPASYSPSVQPWTNAIGRSVPSANENAMIHTEFDHRRKPALFYR